MKPELKGNLGRFYFIPRGLTEVGFLFFIFLFLFLLEMLVKPEFK